MKTPAVGTVGSGWVSSKYIRAFEANPHTQARAIVSRDKARAGQGHRIQPHSLPGARPPGRNAEGREYPHRGYMHSASPARTPGGGGQGRQASGRRKASGAPLGRYAGTSACRARPGVKTVVSFALRRSPLFENIRALRADSVIGILFYPEVDCYYGIGPWYAQHEWNIKKEIGSSSLLTAGCHLG